MLSEIFTLDKRLAVANQGVRSKFPEYESIHLFIDEYLESYAEFNELSIESIVDDYNHFARIYARHLEKFQETGQYPYAYHDNTAVDKLSYDIALILSCVTNPARYEIVHNLADSVKKIDQQKICVIGAGAGIELALIRKFASHARVTAYDFDFNDFIHQHFPLFTFKQENFLDTAVSQEFDIIFAIELLEHIEHYAKLLHKAWLCLQPKGQLICTTATNMPQFDHVYNFKDMELFKTEVQKTGFYIIEHRQFRQNHVFHNIEAKNDWFVLEK